MRRRRLALVAAGALLLAGSPLAFAGADQPLSPEAPQINDNPSDSIGADANSEIVSATFTTTGARSMETVTRFRTETVTKKVTTIKKVGKGKKAKKVKVVKSVTSTVRVPYTVQIPHYVPDVLVAKLSLAGPAKPQAGSSYWSITFSSGACEVNLAWSPGQAVEQDGIATGTFGQSGCGVDPKDPLSGTYTSFTPTITPIGNDLVFSAPLTDMSLAVGATLTNLVAETGASDPVLGGPTGNGTYYDQATTDASYTITKV
jgi:hypothetical protein